MFIKAKIFLIGRLSCGKCSKMTEVSRKKQNRQTCYIRAFPAFMTGLNREKRCKLAAVFVQNLNQPFRGSRVLVSFVNFFSLYPEYIYFFVICVFTPMPTAMATIEHATQLLDFSQKLDITLLDSVVSCFYMAHGPQVNTFSRLFSNF